MGLFKNLFGGAKVTKATDPALCKTAPKTVYVPINGNVIPLKEIADPVFSEGILGQGCGIEPEEERLTAPFDGTVTQIAETRHAIGVTSGDGMELLLHVGIDTVDMQGKGFCVEVKVGETVHCGQTLLTFDTAAIRAAGHLPTVAVLVTNTDDFAQVELLKNGSATIGEPLLKLH